MNESTGLLNEQSAVRTLTVGGTRLTYVLDGAMEMEPAGFFPAVPASFWADHPQALTPRGRVAASVGGVLVQRGGRTLLIDAGLGSVTIPADLGASRAGALLDTLAALGVAPEGIEAVAFTHLHSDHTGWGFTLDSDGVRHRTFPRAAYLVAGREWEPYWRDEIATGAPSRSEVLEPMAGVLTRIDDGQEVFPGVSALVTPGHSPGHTTYVVTDPDSEQRVLVLGDAFHTPGQMTHPEWPSGPDIDIQGVHKARERLLGELERPGTLGFAFHFGDQVFGRVVRDGAGRRTWETVPTEVVLPTPLRLP
ncbi:MBL fold hydrolase [Streptomyces sulfonofaciens]|uniref:MBL fold hydrolase n=1 Tax=Streptomyces sulfonofaciens TaxID=68272 RepID=A0A919L719_9ACTN|nr:MBL fold metallo-hydrolase [Streptomyces sulfonofaciens]GHH86293.1 MBL fold hydrolase [Streptomyces sulfonofaciens]